MSTADAIALCNKIVVERSSNEGSNSTSSQEEKQPETSEIIALEQGIPSDSIAREKSHIKCPCCGFEMVRKKSNLIRHIRRKHGEEYLHLVEEPQSASCMCLECGYKCVRIRGLQDHLVHKHNFELRFEANSFDSREEFEKWKEEIEIAEQTSFVVGSCGSTKDGEHIQYMQCNRGGTYKPKADRCRKRKMKAKGTCKIDRNCTCTLKVIHDKSGKFFTEACLTHYGHDNSLPWLPVKKRKEIAAKIQQEINEEKLLIGIVDNIGSECVIEQTIEQKPKKNRKLKFETLKKKSQNALLDIIGMLDDTDERHAEAMQHLLNATLELKSVFEYMKQTEAIGNLSPEKETTLQQISYSTEKS